jgi:hypothetical protein
MPQRERESRDARQANPTRTDIRAWLAWSAVRVDADDLGGGFQLLAQLLHGFVETVERNDCALVILAATHLSLAPPLPVDKASDTGTAISS